MMLQTEPTRLECDILIIGGGGTGVSATTTAAWHPSEAIKVYRKEKTGNL